MYLDLDEWEIPSQKNNLEIIKVTDKKGFQDFANIFVNNENAFNQYYKWLAEIFTPDDPIEFYVGYANGKPVTRGQIVYFAQVAGIHGISTAINERRKGYGTAIEKFLLSQAKENGFRIAVLQVSEERLPLYLKQGFKECCVFKEFKPQGKL